MFGNCILRQQNFQTKGYSKTIKSAFKIKTGEFTNNHKGSVKV